MALRLLQSPELGGRHFLMSTFLLMSTRMGGEGDEQGSTTSRLPQAPGSGGRPKTTNSQHG